MQNILFYFKERLPADKIIKDLFAEDLQFNFKVIDKIDMIPTAIVDFVPDLVIYKTQDSSHFTKFIKSFRQYDNSPVIVISTRMENCKDYLIKGADDIVASESISVLLTSVISNLEKTRLINKLRIAEEKIKKQKIKYEKKISKASVDLKKREEQLIHSQKMEALGLMASGIAHNFNNILQAIVGYTEFALEDLDKKSQRYEDIQQIEKLTKRASTLIRNLMAVGKEQSLKKMEIEIHDIIKPIVDLTNRNTANNIQVIYNVNKDLPIITADGAMIDQVVLNLFMNATDALPDGGLIKVETTEVNLDNEFCEINAWAKPGTYVRLAISDNGQGMDSETKRRIFEPYFTTKDLSKGTGLGLSTVFGIISQHNGLLNVESKKGKGSRFEVFLPLN